MTIIIVTITIVLALLGTGVAGWSIIKTRNQHFIEYKERKRND